MIFMGLRTCPCKVQSPMYKSQAPSPMQSPDECLQVLLSSWNVFTIFSNYLAMDVVVLALFVIIKHTIVVLLAF
jgi:hypothetical protein